MGIGATIAGYLFGRKKRLRKHCLDKAITVSNNGEFGYQPIKYIIKTAQRLEGYIEDGIDKQLAADKQLTTNKKESECEQTT